MRKPLLWFFAVLFVLAVGAWSLGINGDNAADQDCVELREQIADGFATESQYDAQCR